jgi:hypothetical protein
VRVLRIALAGVLGVGTLSACAGSGRQVSDPPPARATYPVVAAGQAGSVLDAVDAALVRGVTAKDTASTVDARLLGPYQELELANAKIAAARKKDPPKPARMRRLRLIVPIAQFGQADQSDPVDRIAQGWPRFFIAVGNTQDSSTPVLRVLTSATARSPYGLWAEATLLPGATLPPTAPADTGSAALAANATGLVTSPAEVLNGFAGYLNEGARTTASKQYRRSIFSDQLLQRLAADKKSLKAVATVSSKHTVGSVPPLTVRTAGGGALVIGELRQTYTVKVKKGTGKVKVKDNDLAALADGKKQFATSFTRTAVEVVVFNVPPRGRGLITLIAAEKGDVKAVAK